jgi:signal transduction histidine kinase
VVMQLYQPATPTPADASASRGPTADDLAEIIRAYNDVTERLQFSHEKLQAEVVRLRTELASTNAQLQRSRRLSALGEMAAGIAHEVRNPLAAIQLYISMIIEDLQASEPRADVAIENARKVSSAVRGLNAIVGDVLTFARETRPQIAPMPVAAALQRVLDAHRPAIDAARVEVRCEADASLVLLADANLLHQAVLNLVRNAVEAMAGRSERVLTLGACVEEDEHTVLTVRDTGPGIAPADIDRVFNPFFTTRNTGTGLGLAIVHRIVDAHGGSITVQNAPEGGAVFRLFMPINPPVSGGDGASG